MQRSALRFPGTHRVTKLLAGGKVAIYWYRHRGGPLLIRFEGETLGAAHRAEADGKIQLAAAIAAPVAAAPRAAVLKSLVILYRASPEFKKLADTTRFQWGRWLDEIVSTFGDFPLEGMKARGVRSRFKRWRDSRADKPRTADYGMQVLRRLLAFGLDEELIDVNPVADIKSIYRANRADQIVEPDELRKILENATPEAALVFRLAAETGMRRGDLTWIRWEHVYDDRLEFKTSKSGHTRHVMVPLTDAAKAVVADLRALRETFIRRGRVPSACVLISSRGSAWQSASLTQAFIRARGPSGITKHLHDLRGTAVTRWAVAGLANEQIADIVGWEISKVASIRKRYVDTSQIVQGVISQLERGRNAS